MLDLSPEQYAVIAVAFLAGGLVKGIIGITLPLIAVAIMVQAIEPLTAVGLMVLPILVTNFWQALQGGHDGLAAAARRFSPLIVTCFISLSVTAYYAVRLPTVLVLMALGFVLILFAIASFIAPRLTMPPGWFTPAGIAAGLFAGLIGGATSVYGPPINIYLISQHLDKQTWIRSVGLIYSICGLPLLLGYSLNGMFSPPVALVSALACVPAIAGIRLGTHIRGYIPQETFRKILLAVLILVGLSLIHRALSS